ncbi:TetR/AcrR family transcriptional regulator [Rhodococcus erythropolis]|uniref:TetR/AcrR family transcriptional regulator n=1 Tax=Rhodococcus erythropolis TaxID=1833 RepID=UPI00210AE478|nr:TetR/AcrR family transcriptional regulator [Rhodococcus erythropolis]MCQ4129042.1 TetR/AcrR family transcriptional regulator [Rhodococcus erythropolis]
MATLLEDAFGGTRLPRGRHRLSKEDVAQSQRGRLCLAMMDLAADIGYHATSVADVVKSAGVSKRTFYELFDGMDDCFATALETCVAIALTKMNEATETTADQSDWHDLLTVSVHTYLSTLAVEPKAARAMHIEILNAGPAASAARLRMVQIFADRMRALHAVAGQREPDLPEPLPGVFEFFVDGLDGRIRHHLLTAAASTLTTLTPVIVEAGTALLGRPDFIRSRGSLNVTPHSSVP